MSENSASISRYYSVDSVPSSAADDGSNDEDRARSGSREVNGKHCGISRNMNNEEQLKSKGSRKKRSVKSGNKDGTIVSEESVKVARSDTMDGSMKDILSPTVDKTVDQILNESIETVSSLASNSSISDCPFDSSGSSGTPGILRRRGSSLSQPVTDHPLMMTEGQDPTDVSNNRPRSDGQDSTDVSNNRSRSVNESDRQSRDRDTIHLAASSPKPRSLRGSIVSSPSRPSSVSSRRSINEAGLDIDDPLPSGFGTVSKDCSEEDLEGWSEVLSLWKQSSEGRERETERPAGLSDLVKKGIPEALRGQVWQLLANCLNDQSLLSQYSDLVSRECKDEACIQRDVSRTYPAHEYFRDASSLGQESLYRVCKAYANYDTEIGYCQGMSFLTASLLLHMPEEEAFCLLVTIMSDNGQCDTGHCEKNRRSGSGSRGSGSHGYGHRSLFKGGFDQLHLRFYQLDCLIQETLPELSSHFHSIGIESHMYASQWFLTLFTAKFPLFASFFILDLYLLHGINTLFQVSLSLLLLSQEDLLKTDFEGVLRYFRVHLPKKFSTMDHAKVLLQTAVQTNISSATLKKYESSFSCDAYINGQGTGHGSGHGSSQSAGIVISGEEVVRRFQVENKRLVYSNMRLEEENDDLARELVSSKIMLRKQLDTLEDVTDSLRKEIKQLITTNCDLEEDKGRLSDEVTLLKDNFRSEVDKCEREIGRNLKIINDYKSITSQLSQRLEKESEKQEKELEKKEKELEKKEKLIISLVDATRDCDHCHEKMILVMNSSQHSNGSLSDTDKHTLGSGETETDNTPTLDAKIRELELELAQTKLALVEAECVNQVSVSLVSTGQEISCHFFLV